MAQPNASTLPPPNPEHRRIAAGQFERANQVVATGNYDYGIRLLLSCCQLDPANLIYRQALRRTEKAKYRNNLRGSLLAWLLTSRTRFGRALYAVGGSQRVARLSAVPVARTLVLAYVLSGLCGAAGGLFILARTGVGDPKMADGLEFQSIVAVALGGISLSGGRGSMRTLA